MPFGSDFWRSATEHIEPGARIGTQGYLRRLMIKAQESRQEKDLLHKETERQREEKVRQGQTDFLRASILETLDPEDVEKFRPILEKADTPEKLQWLEGKITQTQSDRQSRRQQEREHETQRQVFQSELDVLPASMKELRPQLEALAATGPDGIKRAQRIIDQERASQLSQQRAAASYEMRQPSEEEKIEEAFNKHYEGLKKLNQKDPYENPLPPRGEEAQNWMQSEAVGQFAPEALRLWQQKRVQGAATMATPEQRAAVGGVFGGGQPGAPMPTGPQPPFEQPEPTPEIKQKVADMKQLIANGQVDAQEAIDDARNDEELKPYIFYIESELGGI